MAGEARPVLERAVMKSWKWYLAVVLFAFTPSLRAAVQSKIPCAVHAGYHVNSNTPAEDYLIPLKLTWSATGALEPGQVIYPAPQMEKYEFSPKPLSVLTGKFDLIANFKVAANARDVPYQSLIKVWLQEKLHSH